MNIGKLRSTIEVIGAGVIALSMGVAPGVANSAKEGLVNANDPDQKVGITQTSLAYGPAIHSYRNVESVERETVNPTIVYVSLAYGPAIYSYPRSGHDTVAAFNLQYVDSAYGPAIYSYPYAKLDKPAHSLRLRPLATN